MWGIKNYKEVMEFIKKLCVCDINGISPEGLISYESLVQDATREYWNLVDSKRWEPNTGKEKSKDQPSLPRAYTVAIDNFINNFLNQVDFTSLCSGNDVALEEGQLSSQI